MRRASPRLTAWFDDRPWTGRWGAPVAALLVAGLAGTILGGYWAFLGVNAVTTALLALSAGITFNRAGLLSLCPLSFAALGAWVAGWFTVHDRIPLPVVMLAAAAASAPAGIIVGVLAIRLRGMSLAIATMALAVVGEQLLGVFPVPGQSQGIGVYRPGFAQSQSSYFLFCLVTLAIIGSLVTMLARRGPGAAWSMLRSERATAAAGGSVLLTKLSVFVVSSAIAAVAGVLMAAQSGLVDNSSFGVAASLQVVAIAILVGAGRMEGAVAAGLLGSFFTELLIRVHVSSNLAGVLFGVGAIQILSQGDQGMAGQQQAKRALRRSRRLSPMEPSSGAAAAAAPAVPPAAPAVAVPDLAARPGRTASGPPALEISDLTVRYGSVTALDQVCLVIPPGTVSGLIGPNGAGKTTLLDSATGFAVISSGEVLLHGRPINHMSPDRRARAGLRRTFQQVRISEDLTVQRYLRFAAGRRAPREDLASAVALFGCPPGDRIVGTLDVPARRLVEIAAAVAARPAVLLLDEPAAGLGETETAELAERLARVPELFGTSVLLVEHDMELVRALCSTVTVLDYGKVLASGDPHVVLSTAAVQTAYLGVGTES